MPTATDKASLRRRFLAARNAMDPKTRASASAAISAHLANFLASRRPACVAIYAPHRGEPDVTSLAVDWPAALPVIEGPGIMRFFAWRPGRALAPNRHGIMEPVERDLVTLDARAVVVVPSVGLDRRGWRLGYGGGFYDRLLKDAHAFSIGVAFDSCVVNELPLEEHDQPLAAIVTEQGLQLSR